MSIREAATWFGWNERRTRRAVARGELPQFRVTGSPRGTVRIWVADAEPRELPARDRANPFYSRVLSTYGLSRAEFELMFIAQDGRCPLCLRDFAGIMERGGPVVDHDHMTGKVRGLLCSGCNTGIGRFEHSTEWLDRALAYLAEHRDPRS